jgi:hypothetical protein
VQPLVICEPDILHLLVIKQLEHVNSTSKINQESTIVQVQLYSPLSQMYVNWCPRPQTCNPLVSIACHVSSDILRSSSMFSERRFMARDSMTMTANSDKPVNRYCIMASIASQHHHGPTGTGLYTGYRPHIDANIYQKSSPPLSLCKGNETGIKSPISPLHEPLRRKRNPCRV